jgi:hypothetical protein
MDRFKNEKELRRFQAAVRDATAASDTSNWQRETRTLILNAFGVPHDIYWCGIDPAQPGSDRTVTREVDPSDYSIREDNEDERRELPAP